MAREDSTAVKLVINELARARSIHSDPIHSPLEGWAVIYEEMAELFDAIRAKPPFHDHPHAALRAEGRRVHRAEVAKEAVQVGAMALRFLEDLGLAAAEPARAGADRTAPQDFEKALDEIQVTIDCCREEALRRPSRLEEDACEPLVDLVSERADDLLRWLRSGGGGRSGERRREIFLAICLDRHTDPEVRLFQTRGGAVAAARCMAELNARSPTDVVVSAPPHPAFEWHCRYSPEGDVAYVARAEVE